MNIGLYFGLFNPIHIGHLVISNYMLEFKNFKEIWFIISPQNPLKKKDFIINKKKRLKMVSIAIEKFSNLKVLDIEFYLPKPLYTINTLNILKKQNPKYKFCLIMGADNFITLNKWKNYEKILRYYPIYVYPRYKINIKKIFLYKKIFFVNAPIIEISSSFIRKSINEGKNIKSFLPCKVWRYLINNYN